MSSELKRCMKAEQKAKEKAEKLAQKEKVNSFPYFMIK